MSLQRNAGLGRYSGTRREWRIAYQRARVAEREGVPPDPATSGLTWKAALIVAFERQNSRDRLQWPLLSRLHEKRLIDEIVSAG